MNQTRIRSGQAPGPGDGESGAALPPMPVLTSTVGQRRAGAVARDGDAVRRQVDSMIEKHLPAPRRANPTVPAGVGAKAPVGTVPASAVIAGGELAQLAAGNLDGIGSGAPAAPQPPEVNSQQLTAVMASLEDQVGKAREREAALRSSIDDDRVIIDNLQTELSLIQGDVGWLSGAARDLQARFASARERKAQTTVGTKEHESVLAEIRQLERNQRSLLGVAGDLKAAREQKTSLLEETKTRSSASQALLGTMQSVLATVQSQIDKARSMLNTKQQQDAVMASIDTLSQISEKLSEIMQIVDGGRLEGYKDIIADQARHDVQLRERERVRTEHAAQIINGVTRTVEEQSDDFFMALCATPTTDDAAPVAHPQIVDAAPAMVQPLRSDVARKAMARYGLPLPEAGKPESER